MKKILFILFISLSHLANSQSIDYNTKGDYGAEGYDVLSYFNNTPKKGLNKYIATHDGVKYKFSTQANLDRFTSNPEKYIPQYGGYCAYAVATSGKKVSINPKTYEIRDDKLYLFYNAWGTNTLDLWLDESPEVLKAIADETWERIKGED